MFITFIAIKNRRNATNSNSIKSEVTQTSLKILRDAL